MNKAISAGGIIIKEENGEKWILLVHYAPPDGLIFAKGHVRKGETLEQAALRETREETGLQNLSIIRKLGVVTRKSKEDWGEEVMKDIHLYLMGADNYKQVNPEEDCEWISLEKSLSRMKFQEDADFLRRQF